MQFTHLNVHSSYTLLGATATVDALAERGSQDQLSHLALTDSNALIGAVAFARACRQYNIEPIIGMTLNVASPVEVALSTGQVAPNYTVDGAAPKHAAYQTAGQLVLLAADPDGYRSLCRLSSMIQGSLHRDVLLARGVEFDAVKENSKGLICIGGGSRGWVQRAILHQDDKAAARIVSRLAGIFDDRFFLPIELHAEAHSAKAHSAKAHSAKAHSAKAHSAKVHRAPALSNEDVVDVVIALAQRFGVQTAAVQPVYTLLSEERPQLRLLAAIDQNCPLDQVPDATLPDEGDLTRTLHWLSPSEMAERYANYPGALAATQSIADQCQPSLPDGKPVWPILKSPRDGSVVESPVEALADLAKDGLLDKYGKTASGGAAADGSTAPPPTVLARLEAELAIINQHGYAPLFLLVADIVAYALAEEIPVSTRGSVANSLVAYCCNITTVDPIEHDLLFERFLNPTRSDPPDIDLDFCSRRRDEILMYVRERYGADQVALVATISTLRPRSAIRETAKAYGLPEEAIKRLVKLLPDSWHPDPRRRTRSTQETVLAGLTDPKERTVIEAAFGILGQPHHLSIHPGGLVVTPGHLTDYVPLHLAPKGFLTTQFEHTDVEAIGLPKLDLLGIRALTVLSTATELVRRHYKPDFRLKDIPSGDNVTGQMLAKGDTTGVFQCESSGAKRTLRQLRVQNVGDLAVANAFFKPGPATGGLASNFIRRYRGEEAARYLHDSLKPILGTTYGVLLFQEQILRVAREIAALSWEEADHLRRGMSKFRANEMESMRARFIDGCLAWQDDPESVDCIKPFTEQEAVTLWEQVLAFAGYGFNQGHATAYADVSYRSAFIKGHWPAAFLAARLANRGGFHHPAIYIAEAQRMGFTIRPPSVNHSMRRFELDFEDGQPILWMGLGQVRSLRRDSLQAIIATRQEGPFGSLRDLLSRVPLQQKEILHLIQCGALDNLSDANSVEKDGRPAAAIRRSLLLAEYDELRRAKNAQQMAFGFTEPQAEPESLAQRLVWEQRILDQPVSVHPLETVSLPRDAFPIAKLPSMPNRQVQVAAVRLPGWTGGKGHYFGDGHDYVVGRASGVEIKAARWQPILLTGRWQVDEWGGGWLQIDRGDLL